MFFAAGYNHEEYCGDNITREDWIFSAGFVFWINDSGWQPVISDEIEIVIWESISWYFIKLRESSE